MTKATASPSPSVRGEAQVEVMLTATSTPERPALMSTTASQLMCPDLRTGEAGT